MVAAKSLTRESRSSPRRSASLAAEVSWGKFGNIEDAIIAWNSLPRAPRWAEYNGTEITLPPSDEYVLVSAKAGWRDYDKCRDRGEMLEWRCQGLPLEIGDRWMSWPEGVE